MSFSLPKRYWTYWTNKHSRCGAVSSRTSISMSVDLPTLFTLVTTTRDARHSGRYVCLLAPGHVYEH